jgi:ElaB/YqjD/DUF883 family membrane-anchored ribosome-binding protein
MDVFRRTAMNPDIHDHPVPAPLQTVLELFENELATLKFPDIDQAVLSEAAHAVHEHAESVARAEAALQAAREALQESQELLLQKCQRAVAYARVYAEENAALCDKLDAIGLPRSLRHGKNGAQPGLASDVKPPVRRTQRRQGQRPLFLEPTPAPAVESQAA